MKKEIWLPMFFALAACSWMPHWACHYYRLETQSAFIAGGWNFSPAHSVLAMGVYSCLILLNILSVSLPNCRFSAALLSGLLHITLGVLHSLRLWHPFPFVVFGYEWPAAASLREVLIVFPFGVLCLGVAVYVKCHRPRRGS